MLLPNGNLFVFDNGLNRRFGGPPSFSRGVEYEIDSEAMTVRQVWAFGGERGVEYYSPISDVDHLSATSNRLIMPGIIFGESPSAFVTEVTEAGEVIFDAEVRFRNSLGTGMFSWGQFDLVYRSERIALYPND